MIKKSPKTKTKATVKVQAKTKAKPKKIKLLDKNQENVNKLLAACEQLEKHLEKQSGVKDHDEHSHKKFRSDRSYCNAMNHRAVIALKWILETKHSPQEKLRHFAAAFADYEPRFSIKTTKENDKAMQKFLELIRLTIPFINHAHALTASHKSWQKLNEKKKNHGFSMSFYDRRGAH